MDRNLDMPTFVQTLQRHFIDHPAVAPHFPENQDRLETMLEDGIVFLRDYVPRDVVAGLVEKFGWLPSSLRDGKLAQLDPRSYEIERAWGLYRVYDVDQMFPESRLLIEDPVVRDIVNAYLAGHAFHTRTCIELRDTPVDEEAMVEHILPHFDNFYREVKVWLFLADVTMDSGPMRYYTKTHKFSPWRTVWEYLFYTGGIHRHAMAVHPYAMRLLMETSPELTGVKRINCTGTAGTVVIADTRGIHRAFYTKLGHQRLDMYSDYRMDNYVYH